MVKNIEPLFRSKAENFLRKVAGTERAMKTIKTPKKDNSMERLDKLYDKVGKKAKNFIQKSSMAGNYLTYQSVSLLGGKPRYRRLK